MKFLLDRFNMVNFRPLCVLVSMGKRLSVDDCPKSPGEVGGHE